MWNQWYWYDPVVRLKYVQIATIQLVDLSKDIYMIIREIIQIFQALRIYSPQANVISNCVYLLSDILYWWMTKDKIGNTNSDLSSLLHSIQELALIIPVFNKRNIIKYSGMSM